MAESGKSSNSLNLITRFFLKKVRTVYYSARESIGDHKREILVYQVGQTCTSLQETRDEFQSALEHFKDLACINESGAEHKYNLLNRQYLFCCSKSDTVSNRIKALEEVSEALFVEWENELNEYTNSVLRNSSKRRLKSARQNYTRLIKAIQKAENKIQPVLAAFKDQVLYLKHHLNARAIAALQHEFIEISVDISQLIQAMEHTILEASQFVSILVDQKALPDR